MEFNFIYESDISSGFPNLNLHSLKKALLHDRLVPPDMINLILHHLKSPLIESSFFPNFETFVENMYNKSWRTSDRSVHMGLGISPLLFVITLN